MEPIFTLDASKFTGLYDSDEIVPLPKKKEKKRKKVT